MREGNPLNVTGEHRSKPGGPTVKLSPVRRRVSTGRLSQDLRNCVAGLQSPDAVEEYFPGREGWVIGRVEPDSVPGLGGGGIRARREHTEARAIEVIFGRDSHAIVLMPRAGSIGMPISDTESMVVAPLDGEEPGIRVTKGRPIRGGLGYLMLTAEYGDSREFLGSVVRFCAPGHEQIQTAIEARIEEGTGVIRPIRASIPVPAESGGPSEIYLRAEGNGEDDTGRRLILELNDRDTLVIEGLTDSIEIGRLFAMIRAEARRALTKIG